MIRQIDITMQLYDMICFESGKICQPKVYFSLVEDQMLKEKSKQVSVHQNYLQETKVRWGAKNLPIVRFQHLSVLVLILFLSVGVVFAATDAPCRKTGVVLQILGSGGPFGGDGRASSGYLVWVNGRPQVMIDAGGGTLLRLQQAGARVEHIKLIGISHFHPDHASELPALLWSSIASPRYNQLVVGPSGNGTIPGLGSFLDSLFAVKTGAFQWLDSIGPSFQKVEVEFQSKSPVDVYKDDDLKVTVIYVPHGNLPTLGYRIDIGDVSIGYGADQTGTNPAFVKLVKNVDVLIMHLGVSEEAAGVSAWLHAKPSVVGKIAQEAGVRTLVLSHFMKLDRAHPYARNFSLHNLESNLAQLKNNYSGTVVLAEDLQCIEVKKITGKQ